MVRELKPDGSIVTNGDREVETFLRKELPTLIPGTTVWGEEFGYSEPGPAGVWLVDPIDGTSNFAYGSPMWGVSIGLMKDNTSRLGAVMLPDLDELYLCAVGEGVTANGKALAPIPPGPILKHELLSVCRDVVDVMPGKKPTGKQRCTGALVIDGTFTARQRFRGFIGMHERLYDVAPCVLFCEELGADIRYADGSPLEFADLLDNKKIPKPWVIYPVGALDA